MPATAWNLATIGNGILKDGSLYFGSCAHNGHSGANANSDGGLETFLGSTGWARLEAEVRDATKLKGGRENRHCVKGPAFQRCAKVALIAPWVPMAELPSIVWLS